MKLDDLGIRIDLEAALAFQYEQSRWGDLDHFAGDGGGELRVARGCAGAFVIRAAAQRRLRHELENTEQAGTAPRLGIETALVGGLGILRSHGALGDENSDVIA